MAFCESDSPVLKMQAGDCMHKHTSLIKACLTCNIGSYCFIRPRMVPQKLNKDQSLERDMDEQREERGSRSAGSWRCCISMRNKREVPHTPTPGGQTWQRKIISTIYIDEAARDDAVGQAKTTLMLQEGGVAAWTGTIVMHDGDGCILATCSALHNSQQERYRLGSDVYCSCPDPGRLESGETVIFSIAP